MPPWLFPSYTSSPARYSGLPFSLIDGPRARSVVDVAEQQLWTRLGPRSLSPSHPDYHPIYAGGPGERGVVSVFLPHPPTRAATSTTVSAMPRARMPPCYGR